MIDRFICRREGHKSSMTVRSSWDISSLQLLTTCQRCGKWFETSYERRGRNPEDPTPNKETERSSDGR
jgi:hypothetical protein